jgi:hypothetical protein
MKNMIHFCLIFSALTLISCGDSKKEEEQRELNAVTTELNNLLEVVHILGTYVEVEKDNYLREVTDMNAAPNKGYFISEAYHFKDNKEYVGGQLNLVNFEVRGQLNLVS